MAQGGLGGKKLPRPALGRGLSALVSSAPAQAAQVDSVAASATVSSTVEYAPINTDGGEIAKPQASGVTTLPISQLRANPDQPRQDFSDPEIAELAESIKALGVIQPILVRPQSSSNGAYQIVAGERRFRAAIRAGLSQVPVVIKDFTEKEVLEVALVENIQRQGLNPIEEALGYQKLVDEFSLTVSEVAERVGKDRATVANTTRLLKLPQLVQEMVRDGRISAGHAKAILTVKEPSAQINLANKIIADSLSVRAVESIVARDVVLDPPKRVVVGEVSAARAERVASYPEIEERLRNALGTKVQIQKRRKGGIVELHYFSDEELDRLVQMLAGAESERFFTN